MQRSPAGTPRYEVRPRALCKIGHENGGLLSAQLENRVIFCLLNTTHYCITNFNSGTVQKETNANNSFCFLNFEFV